MFCNFDFARAKYFVQKKSHRLLLREAVQRAEAPDQIHGVDADDGPVAEQFALDTSIRPSAHQHPHAPRNEKNSGNFPDEQAFRRNFLNEHKHGDDGDPPEVHHAGHEQQRHEKPAAAGAIRAVFQAHCQRAGLSFAPIGRQKTQWRAAARQTGIFQRRPLENSGNN